MKAIVTGSVAYDILTHYPGKLSERLVKDDNSTISISLLVDSQVKQFGGTATNIAYTLKLLGVDPLVCSSVGSDFKPYADYLHIHKITTKYFHSLPKYHTSAYYATSDKGGGQIGIFYSGPMAENKNLDLAQAAKTSDLAIISPNDPDSSAALVAQCQRLNLPFIYNPGFNTLILSPETMLSAVKATSVLIGNDAEFEIMIGKLEMSLEQICKLVPAVVQTIGSKGSILYQSGSAIAIPVAKISKFVDPSGAGDAYLSGFTAGYLHKYDLETCCRMGSVTAAYTVEHYGTQLHNFSKNQFKQRYRYNFLQDLKL